MAWARRTFLANGTMTVPAGVTEMHATALGGGGGGGGGFYGGFSAGDGYGGAPGGGGGAAKLYSATLVVQPGNTLDVTVGAGGAGGTAGNPTGPVAPTAGGNGASSVVFDSSVSETLLEAPGASGGAQGVDRGRIVGAVTSTRPRGGTPTQRGTFAGSVIENLLQEGGHGGGGGTVGTNETPSARGYGESGAHNEGGENGTVSGVYTAGAGGGGGAPGPLVTSSGSGASPGVGGRGMDGNSSTGGGDGYAGAANTGGGGGGGGGGAANAGVAQPGYAGGAGGSGFVELVWWE